MSANSTLQRNCLFPKPTAQVTMSTKGLVLKQGSKEAILNGHASLIQNFNTSETYLISVWISIKKSIQVEESVCFGRRQRRLEVKTVSD